MSTEEIKRRQSINYINDDDAPLLLTFNSLERGDLDDDFIKTNSFMYNSQEDMYRLNSLKKSRMNERVNSNNLEIIDEEGDNGKEDEFSDNAIISNLTNINFKEEKLSLLFIIMISYLIFCVIELLFGYFFNSLILMADAANYFSESACFGFYIIIIYITKVKATNDISFGFHRGEIMGILVRASFLLGFSFWLIFYIIKSWRYNHLANGIVIIIIGIISTLYNLIMGLILMLLGLSNNVSFSMQKNKDHSEDELNNKNAKISFIHIIFKSIQSIIIILTGVLVYFLPSLLYIDPLGTLLLTLVLLYNSFYHLNGSIKILIKDSPLEFDVEKLKKDLKEIEGIVDVLFVNVWNLNQGKKSLSCHLITSDPKNALNKSRELLKKKYNITHSTIYVELYNVKKKKN